MAVAFLVASLRRPRTIAFFQKPGMPPLVQKFGTVAAAHGVALFVAIVFVVFRY